MGRCLRGRPGRAALVGVAVASGALALSACGSRLATDQIPLAQGASGAGGGTAAVGVAQPTATATAAAGTTAGAGTTAAGGTGSGGGTGGGPAGATGTAGGTGPAAGAAGAKTAAAPVAPKAGAATTTTAPAGGNGGATTVGVTATQITIANIASISGVAPGLTQSAQQAVEAFAAYVNSQGGIYGRTLKVEPFDDQNSSSQNYADAEQACSNAFAMVGNASGFDTGSAQAVDACGIPDVAAENSTTQAGEAADIFAASPGNAHYWPLGAATYLKSKYPTAVQHAAMIYLNVPATQSQAQHEMAAYKSVGFDYVYTAQVTPTEPNYSPYVLQMQQKGVQYVTEYSDASSAARLLQAMQQQNFQPQVVDWYSEEYTPSFVQQTQGESDGNLVLMATAAYEEAGGNPQMQTFLSWLNRVAPGAKHNIFGIFAWSAGMAFLQAAKAVGPHLTRAALLAQLAQIHTWTGGGLQPKENFGTKVPSQCFSYFSISGSGFARAYPSGAGSYTCNSGLFKY
ncbi:MAG TPA: ABC transporter substrate-binding protein [Acidimicrobiales bacterium]|nr:ABC transporter substrate-binding protein [Acidimicrobiales bacterium]